MLRPPPVQPHTPSMGRPVCAGPQPVRDRGAASCHLPYMMTRMRSVPFSPIPSNRRPALQRFVWTPRSTLPRLLWAALWAALCALCVSPAARAQPTSDSVAPVASVEPTGSPPDGTALSREQMQADMRTYFDGERRGGLWLLAVSSASIAVGGGVLLADSDFARGMSIPLLTLGTAELIGSIAFYRNSLRRVPRFTAQIDQDPIGYQTTELRRMRRVQREMHMLEVIELSFLMAGGAMTAIGTLQGQDLVAGIGSGLMTQAVVLLLYDQLASRRADRYAASLARFQVTLTPAPAIGATGATPASLAHGAIVSAQLRMP